MPGRWSYACLTALILAAFTGAWWMRPASARIDPEAFDRLTNEMTLDDLRTMLGEPYGVQKNERGEDEATTLGKDALLVD